jgi:hypothetical protein
MKTIRSTFNTAASGAISFSFRIDWLLLLALAICDDRERSEKKKREKREQAAKSVQAKPPAGPRPF